MATDIKDLWNTDVVKFRILFPTNKTYNFIDDNLPLTEAYANRILNGLTRSLVLFQQVEIQQIENDLLVISYLSAQFILPSNMLLFPHFSEGNPLYLQKWYLLRKNKLNIRWNKTHFIIHAYFYINWPHTITPIFGNR